QQPPVVALAVATDGRTRADRKRLVGRSADAARLLHRRRRHPRAVLDLPGADEYRGPPGVVPAGAIWLKSMKGNFTLHPSHPLKIAFALLGDRLAIDATVRKRRGLEPLEGNLDAALGAHPVGALVDAPQGRT